MQQVKLQLADNGVIRTVVDDNINGGGESYESTTVYEFNTITNKIRFIEELCIDIGLEFGNSKSKTQIQIKSDWGATYKPTQKEIDFKIKNLEAYIKQLRKDSNG
jgi:hypothetical protein